ncbi:G-protein alpha subunit [Russula dissimulans]|nr:G-protein alpha subunit [Russula dissimulans]
MNSLPSWKQRQATKRAKLRAKAHSDEIDRQLQEQSKDFRQQHNVLLISTPESEAEAFALVKQMKLTHEDYSNEELADFRPDIWRILLEISRSIVKTLRALKPRHTSRATRAKCEFIMGHRSDVDSPEFLFHPRFAQVVQDLWVEEIIPLLWHRPSALYLTDNAEYFVSEAPRIATEEYTPSIEDISHASEKGIMETHFDVDQLSIRISQVYGQQGIFRKWIHLFDDVTSVMFCASLADYDEPGRSSRSRRTRLIESLILFEAVVNSQWFLRTSIILFWTGFNEFRAKLHEVPLVEYFPEYTGGTDADEGARCILLRFLEVNRARLHIYSHIAEVSNVPGIRPLVAAVEDTVIRNTLSASDLL